MSQGTSNGPVISKKKKSQLFEPSKFTVKLLKEPGDGEITFSVVIDCSLKCVF